MAKSGGNKPTRGSKLPIASSPPIVFTVRGVPAPKGSAQAFAFKRGDGSFGARVVPGGAATTRAKIIGWDGAVRDAAAQAIGSGRVTPPFVGVALHVSILFRLARPAGHFGTGRNAGTIKDSSNPFPSGKPDIDKLARTTLDAMTGIVFDDDSRIATLDLDKIYATPGDEGATIQITRKPSPVDVDPAIAGELPAVRVPVAGDAGRMCEVCGDPTPYTDWPRCERCNAAGPILRLVPPLAPISTATLELVPPTSLDVAVARARAKDATRARIRKSIGGTTFAAESHAMRRHTPPKVPDPDDDFGGDL